MKGEIFMQDYNTIIGAIQMRLNKCPTRSVMDRYNIGSGTLVFSDKYEPSARTFWTSLTEDENHPRGDCTTEFNQ